MIGPAPEDICNAMKHLAPAALAAVLAVSACSVTGDRSGTPEVPFEVVERFGDDLEIRSYPLRTVAEVRLAPDDGGQNSAFRVLFRYIDGANDGGAKISMTTPVETAQGAEIAMTAPVETAQDDAGLRMRFFLPQGMTAATAPQPTDPRVTLLDLPPRTEAALRFSGPVRPARVHDLEPGLRDRLTAAGWQAEGPVRAYFYDGPFTLPWLRRNEAVVPVGRVSG